MPESVSSLLSVSSDVQKRIHYAYHGWTVKHHQELHAHILHRQNAPRCYRHITAWHSHHHQHHSPSSFWALIIQKIHPHCLSLSITPPSLHTTETLHPFSPSLLHSRMIVQFDRSRDSDTRIRQVLIHNPSSLSNFPLSYQTKLHFYQFNILLIFF